MAEEQKVLLAVGIKDLEQVLIKRLSDNYRVADSVATHKDIVLERIEYERPHVVIILERLDGSKPIEDLILDIRGSYPNTRIIFITSRENPRDTLLRTLVSYAVYDLVMGKQVSIDAIEERLRHPNELKDVQQFVQRSGDIVDTEPRQRQPLQVKVPIDDTEDDIEIDEVEPEEEPEKKQGFLKGIFGRKKKRKGIVEASDEDDRDSAEDTDVDIPEPEPKPIPTPKVKPKPVPVPTPPKAQPPVPNETVTTPEDKPYNPLANAGTAHTINKPIKTPPPRPNAVPKKKPKPPIPVQPVQKKPIENPEPAQPTLVKSPPKQQKPKKSGLFSKGPQENSKKIKVNSNRIITFVSPTAGLGGTHVAFNAALKLADEGNKVLYIDGNSDYSSVDIMFQLGNWEQGIDRALMDIEHNGGSKISSNILRIKDLKQEAKSQKDKTFIRLREPLPNTLDFMFYSHEYQTLPEQYDVPKRRLRELMMYLLTREQYDVIVVDSEPMGTDGVDELLNISTKVYITITQNPALVGLLNRRLDATEDRVELTDRKFIVLNKFEDVEPTVSTFSEWVRLPIVQTIPYDNRESIQTTFEGLPLVLRSLNNELKDAFEGLARHIAE